MLDRIHIHHPATIKHSGHGLLQRCQVSVLKQSRCGQRKDLVAIEREIGWQKQQQRRRLPAFLQPTRLAFDGRQADDAIK